MGCVPYLVPGEGKVMRKIIFALLALAFSVLLPAVALAQVPVVDAGPDQTIILGDSLTLHGTATNDPIAWWWEVISAPAGSTYSLFAASSADPIFHTQTLGNYVITLIAQNIFGWSDPDAVVITVVPNQPPTAIADATPLSGPAPLLVTFDGSLSSDPEGGSLHYSWDFGDLSSATGVMPTHEYQFPGIYVADLRVTDDRGDYDYDTVEITVTEPNPVPSISFGGLALLAGLVLGSVVWAQQRWQRR
jgi:PKD repeat protein